MSAAYAQRVRALEAEGLTTSDAQAVADAENAGARMADDHFCQGCGARGVFGFCAECR